MKYISPLQFIQSLQCHLLFGGTLASTDIISKAGQFNSMQDFNQGGPSYWLLASSSQPHTEDFCIDPFRIVRVFVGHALYL